MGAGQRSAIATLVERKTRLTVLVRLHGDHSAQSVGDALIEVFMSMPARMRRTLTWDQGNEMFHHQRIEHATGLRIYFADPHSPWQRGSNENTNGLLRQYLPKGTEEHQSEPRPPRRRPPSWTGCRYARSWTRDPPPPGAFRDRGARSSPHATPSQEHSW
jgi:IS30 family transposase